MVSFSTLRSMVPLPVLARLRAAKRRVVVSTFRKRTVVHSYLGRSLTVELADPIGEKWYDQDYNQLAEIDYLNELGLSGGIKKVFELGAHQGVVAMMLADFVGDEGKVLAIEASSFNFDLASRNVQNNKIENVILRNVAIGHSNGLIDFVDNGNGYVSRGKKEQTQKVESITIDSLIAELWQPDLILLDIEGFEFAALSQGASAALLGDIIWLVELHGDETLQAYGGSNERCASLFPKGRFSYYFAGLDEPVVQFTEIEDLSELPRERVYFLAVPESRLVRVTT
jgi:FkbM family methyltransferase